MSKNLIRLSLIVLLLCHATSSLLLVRAHIYSKYFFIYWLLLACGLICWAYVAIRISGFLDKLRVFFRHLLSGNYQAGIKDTENLRDEIGALEELINKTADRLRAYDELRAQRVAFSSRALEQICKNVDQGVIIADMEKEVFRLNPAAQSLFDIKQESITFESMMKNEENGQFGELFRNASEREKVPQEGRVRLKLPIRGSSRDVLVRIAPLKDNDEKVKLAVIFVDAAGK